MHALSIRRFVPITTLTTCALAVLAAGCAQMPAMPGFGGPQTLAPAAAPPPLVPFDGIRKRVAVLKLENKTKTPLPDASWQIGEGLTEMLTTELFKTGRFVIVERAALADIVREQELGQTGLVQKETAVKVGEVLGAQMLITGAITEFEASSGGGGSGVNVRGINLQLRGNTAHVAVDIRLVDASTGQILRSHSAEATAQETGIAILATRRQTTLGSDAFQKTPLGQATREAVAKAIDFIVNAMETVPWTGRVVQTKGKEIYVNAGANANLRPGATFGAYAKGEELRDPATGMMLGSRDTHVGTVTISHVEDRFSIGAFNGNGKIKRGDLLKPDISTLTRQTEK